MGFTFNKSDRLKGKKLIEQLFLEGKTITVFPFRMFFKQTENEKGSKIKAGVSVSKRNFKKAVDRNRIKRLIREAYRLNKPQYFNNITASYALMILYIGKDMPDFDSVDSKLKLLFLSFIEKISKNNV